MIGKFNKQPAETLDYDVDFSEFFSDGDTLLTSGDPPVPYPLDVVSTPPGLQLGSTFVLNGSIIKQWVSGGENGVKYKVTITATSTSGRVKQVEFQIRVKDE